MICDCSSIKKDMKYFLHFAIFLKIIDYFNNAVYTKIKSKYLPLADGAG